LFLLEDYELAMKLARLGRWAVISTPLIQKNNDTDGIGVEAMRDPIAHLESISLVLGELIKREVNPDSRPAALLRAAWNEVRGGIRARRLMDAECPLSTRIMGRVMLMFLKLRGRLRRKLPSWPQADISGV
jgi:hypothetical protein